AITALRSALEGDEAETIKARTDDLVQASMKLGEAMYKAQQADAQAGAGAAPGGDAGAAKGEKVVDAEFEDVTDKNKKTGSG
ncbi:MAG: molecular chaperone DnaK, partial [Alphaproteobacteria bacterium]|nr:molecular chaperone DnaK [Alphaproteobacteria bacterium]